MTNASKWVYITGCDSGFGRLAVDLFVEQGYGVFAGVLFESSLSKLRAAGGKQVIPLLLNVTSEASVAEAAREITQHCADNKAQLVAVVNNAGILVQPCPTEWQSLKDFRDMMDVNLFGMVSVTQSVLPLIRASQGRIVCTSSIAGRMGIPTQAAYCASKYAVQGYCDTLRRDMLCWGVSVHIIEPGIFPNTGLYERFEKGLDSVWARLDPHLQEEYGEAHYKYLRRALSTAVSRFGTEDSSVVSKAYLHAVTSPQPKYRYRLGADSKYVTTLVSHLHESTQDALLTMGDGSNRFVKPSAAPQDGKARVMARMDRNWPQFLAILAALLLLGWRLKRGSATTHV